MLVNSATLIEVKQFNVETTHKILPSIDILIYLGQESPIAENYQILRRRQSNAADTPRMLASAVVDGEVASG